ncbi:AlwI family type II restriction endonuclease [Aliarcobacter cryaerophilus]|uniref:AlwI family type II restriction endonuclease n=1 Tax=Aliarcobacter cryaerophilus TaxID=28198 RepID=UPI0015E82D48|nr:AlwI family type II restriction endonuclease [Aliarcobacter cryaerophilus]
MSYDISKIKFQTYSWGFGTTSFRESELKYKIEKQLIILENYREDKKDIKWKDFQIEYFSHLVEDELAKSTANDKQKDARIKTSSLKDLGLVNKERFLQNTAIELLEIVKANTKKDTNIFGINKDNFLYLKQFLKMEFSKNIENDRYASFSIKPFIAIIYSLLMKNNKLPRSFFTYILPTIKNYDELKTILSSNIENIDINHYILNKIKDMDNYKNALECFKSESKNNDLFKEKNVFMNNNGGKYDIKYLKFYNSIKKYDKSIKNNSKKLKIINEIVYPDKTNKKIFYNFMFKLDSRPSKSKLNEDLISVFEDSLIFKYTDSFDENFFYMVQLEKWIRNLEEYYDLNKRFLELTNLFIFEKEYLYLDEIAYIVFNEKKDSLLDIPLSISKDKYLNNLYSSKSLEEISEIFNFDREHLLRELNKKYRDIDIHGDLNIQINKIKKENEKKYFDTLIDKHFTNDKIKSLLLNIKDRVNDKEILDYLDWDTNVPTIFEYIIGIIWYNISKREGYITDFMNLSLDAKLLPRRFAGGGQSDIIYKYSSHHLLIEVTLANKDNQRKMELEPVSRHLGRYMIENGNEHYALFIVPYLDPNVLVGLRAYSKLNYYNTSNTDEYVSNLKIIPLEIDDILHLMEKDIKYDFFYDNIVENSYLNPELGVSI